MKAKGVSAGAFNLMDTRRQSQKQPNAVHIKNRTTMPYIVDDESELPYYQYEIQNDFARGRDNLAYEDTKM
jgi:hypothetical protein